MAIRRRKRRAGRALMRCSGRLCRSDAIAWCAERLELRVLLTSGPSPAEQELLEHLNRMRADPQGELDRLFSSYPSPLVARDPAVQIAVDTFGVDGETLVSQFSTLESAPPLVWNDSLHDAALTHNELMIAHDEQSHQLPGESVLLRRVIDAGYRWLFSIEVGENVFAQSYTPTFTHAGFAIDWGSTATGIQDPPGHRNTMMNPAFEEVGISIVEELDLQTEVGPLVVTQNFGTRGNFSSPYLTGVVFDDVNEDGIFNAGEGLSDVSITVTGPGGFYSTTSMTAGGYQLRVAPGFWTITASGGGLSEPIVYSNVHIGVQNFKLDFEVDAEPVPDVYEITLADGSGQHVVIEDDGIAGNGWMQFALDGAITQFRAPTTTLRIVGGTGDDTVELRSMDVAFAGDIEVVAGDGDDQVDASLLLSPVAIDGGAGRDVLIGGAAGDRLIAGAGSDDLRGGPGNDTLAGGAGRDTLVGGAGHDRLSGQGGSGDVLTGAAGDDTLSGGRGSDRLMEVGDADFILTDEQLLGLGTDSFEAIEFVLLFGGLEDNRIDASAFALPGARLKLAGGGGNDELIGSPLADLLIGNGGNDTLTGAGGDDTLLGGRHHDSLTGGDGNDVLIGLTGRDTLLGGDGDDYLEGGDGSDGLAGGAGADMLTGGSDADTLFGNADDDTLFGGGGADVVIGGEGDDVLKGNSGTDTLTAGTGDDDASPEDRTAGDDSEIDESFVLSAMPEWIDAV